MKQFIIILSFTLSQTGGIIYAQAMNPYPFFVKVKTDSGIIKQILWEVYDSSICVTDIRMKNRQFIPVISIYSIDIKRPIITTPLRALVAGAFIGGVLFSLAYIDDWARHTDNCASRDFTDPYLRSLGYSALTGASIGFTTGLIQAVFFKKRVVLDKSQYRFGQMKKS